MSTESSRSIQLTNLDTNALADLSKSVSCFVGTADDSVSYQTGAVLPSGGENGGASALTYQASADNGQGTAGGGMGTKAAGMRLNLTASSGASFGSVFSEATQTELLRKRQVDEDERSAFAAFSAEWEICGHLGAGGFASVFKAYRKSDPNKVMRAVKVSKGSQGTIRELENEVELLMLVPSHPNVVQPLHFIQSNGTASSVSFLVMEYCELGSLQGMMDREKRLPEDTVREIAHQVLAGLAFLSRSGVTHQDIKGANILLARSGASNSNNSSTGGGSVSNSGNNGGERLLYKLADFGLSTLAQGSGTDAIRGGGTIRYMPREALVADAASAGSSASDLWALGCTLSYLLTGVKPWADKAGGGESSDFWRLRALIINVPYGSKERESHHPTIPEWLSDESTSFMKQLLSLDPVKRGTAQQLLAHPWIRDAAAGRSKVASNLVSSNSNSLSNSGSGLLLSCSSPTSASSSAAAAASEALVHNPTMTIVNEDQKIDAELLAAAIQQVEEEPANARLWAMVGRLCGADQTISILGSSYTRKQCLLRACRLAPHKLMFWNLLGRELIMLNNPELHRGSVLLAALLARRNSPTSPKQPDEIDVDAAHCFCRCLEINETAVGYRNLGLSLQLGETATVMWGGGRAPETFTKQQAYLKAVQLAPSVGAGWTNLGVTVNTNETVVVSGVSYTKLQLFVMALTKTPYLAAAWGNIGNLLRANETVVVNGEKVGKVLAHSRALETMPAATHWNNLGHALDMNKDAVVAGRSVSKIQCFLNALALDPKNAGRWRTLGYWMTKGNIDRVYFDGASGYTPLECYVHATMLQPTSSVRWSELAALMTDLGVKDVQVAAGNGGEDGRKMSLLECLVRAASLDAEDASVLYQLREMLRKNEVTAAASSAPAPSAVACGTGKNGDDDSSRTGSGSTSPSPSFDNLSDSSIRVQINGEVCTAADCESKLYALLRKFYAAVDKFNGAQVTDHDRIYECAQGHPLLPHVSRTWRCEMCRSRPVESGGAPPMSLACRRCDVDVCRSCWTQYANGLEALPTELAMGANFVPALAQQSSSGMLMTGACFSTSASNVLAAEQPEQQKQKSHDGAENGDDATANLMMQVTMTLALGSGGGDTTTTTTSSSGSRDGAATSMSWTNMPLGAALKITEHREATQRGVVALEEEQARRMMVKQTTSLLLPLPPPPQRK